MRYRAYLTSGEAFVQTCCLKIRSNPLSESIGTWSIRMKSLFKFVAMGILVSAVGCQSCPKTVYAPLPPCPPAISASGLCPPGTAPTFLPPATVETYPPPVLYQQRSAPAAALPSPTAVPAPSRPSVLPAPSLVQPTQGTQPYKAPVQFNPARIA